jgi:hypothetical protein
LRALVATGEQHDQHICPLNEVHTVAWAVVDTQL